MYGIEGNSEEAKAKLIELPIGLIGAKVEAKVIEKTGAKVEAKLLKGSSKDVDFTFDPKKIGKQMDKRGWTEDSIKDTLNNPVKTVKTQDTRWLPGAEKPLNDPATAYYAKDGSYVVRNDKTGEITQISNKNDPNWIAPWDTK